MNITIYKVTTKDIDHLRKELLKEINNQFVCYKMQLYGWADIYAFKRGDAVVGYGSVWGKDDREKRDTVCEFYLVPEVRADYPIYLREFVMASGAGWVDSQTNDPLLAPVLFEFGSNLNTEAILFEDGFDSNLEFPGASLRAKEASSNEVDRQYTLLYNYEEVGEGGLLLNYNFPYADIYYEIHLEHRKKGLGSFMVQELKTEAYRLGRVPAARSNPTNYFSHRAMKRAGMRVCGWRVVGEIRASL